MTGEGPQELRDYFFPQTGETDEEGRPMRMSMPTYVKDVYHYAKEPTRTIANKVAPLPNLLAEMIRNEDFFGTKIRNEDDPLIQQLLDLAKHGAGGFVPFGFRNIEREREKGGSLGIASQSFVGITPAPAALNRTAAEQLASELMREQMPEGGRTKEEFERATLRRKVMRSVAMKKGIPPEARQAVQDGRLTARQVVDAAIAARDTSLVRTFRRLGAEEAIKVYEVANEKERKKLRPLLALKAAGLAARPKAERDRLLPRVRALLKEKYGYSEDSVESDR
jgi:hypothetical protein